MEDNKLTFDELLQKAKNCASPEEIVSLVAENGLEMSGEQAKEYYDRLNRLGELSDEELNSAAGGGCHKKDGRLVVTVGYSCDNYQCRYCDVAYTDHYCLGKSGTSAEWVKKNCNSCRYCSYENALWLCNHVNNFA